MTTYDKVTCFVEIKSDTQGRRGFSRVAPSHADQAPNEKAQGRAASSRVPCSNGLDPTRDPLEKALELGLRALKANDL